MPINVPMYTPRLPIGGGGGVIDLSAKENQSKQLIAQALGELVGGITRKPQQKTGGRIVVGDGTTWLVYPDGSKEDLGIPPPKGKASAELMDMWLKLGEYEEPSPEEEMLRKSIGQQLMEERGVSQRTTPISPALQSMADQWLEPQDAGVTGPAGVRTPFVSALPTLPEPSKTGVRESPARALGIGSIPQRRPVSSKEIPPKPKEYPDAKWNEEHKIWTIIKNGRLMGIK